MKFIRIIYLVFILTLIQINAGLAQKKIIDPASYDSWPGTQYESLSNNGKYTRYSIGNQKEGYHHLILQKNDAKWRKEFIGIETSIFTQDSKRAILSVPDRMYIVKLGTDITDSVLDVVSFKLPKNGYGEWIAYRQGAKEGKLVLRNLESDRSFEFLSVKNYYFNGHGLILLREEETGRQHLDWVNIPGGKVSNIWNGNGLQDVIFNSAGDKLAFIANNQNNAINKNGIWYYELGIKEAYCLLPDLNPIMDSSLELSSIKYFSTDNSQLFFTLKERSHSKENINIDSSQPEIWSYNDKMLQSQQKKEGSLEGHNYLSVVNISARTLFRIEEKNESSSASYNPPLGDYVVVYHRDEDAACCEGSWNSSLIATPFLVSTKTGKRVSLNSMGDNFSPNMSKYGKYFIYTDKENRNFFTYEIASGITRNITKNINATWERRFSNPIVGWVNNDSAVVLYDCNDVWLVDPKGGFSPVNLTNGYGKKTNIQFFLTLEYGAPIAFTKRQKVFLTAFNPGTKENGFYSFTFGEKADPALLTMGPVLYNRPDGAATPDGVNFPPRKAKDVNSFIVRRMSATEYPNLFYTTDFKNFISLTDFHPQKNYNWYSTELHQWKSLDGTSLHGILYKPANFDSTKRYPVIFNYYESMSDGLNAFLMPAALNNGCVINIPYYVSKGYLVFCPDIEYTIGDPMQGTYNAVVSAAQHVMQLPFVDPRKMGVQGCSWGAIQTNYLITQTNLFAAACSASGVADWVSGYNSLFDNGASLQGFYEAGQMRVGGNLWDSLQTYIKSSPILHANKITTPLLLMHTKNDGVCPFTNAIEFATALRRLGKKSWLLVYEGNHGIWGNEGKDFSIRMGQFFDHYLKDKPAPIWMTRGISASKRGLDTGYEYDTEIKTPGTGLLKIEEQKKADSIMVRKPILIELK